MKNLDEIKELIQNSLNKKVVVRVYGLRNKNLTYRGVLINAYPNIFTVLADNEHKSFSYADVITGEVVLEF